MKFMANVRSLSKEERKFLKENPERANRVKNIIAVGIAMLLLVFSCTSDVQYYQANAVSIITQKSMCNPLLVEEYFDESTEIAQTDNHDDLIITTESVLKTSISTTTSTVVSTTTTTTTTVTIVETATSTEILSEKVQEPIEKLVTEQNVPEVIEPIQENTSVSINETVDSWSDYELLAHLINAEAGNCTQEEMLWTGQVVLNRVASQYFPNSIREVIFQSGQYSTTWGGQIYLEASQECYDAAQLLMDGNTYIPSNVLFQTNGYLKYVLYATTEHGLKFYSYGD